MSTTRRAVGKSSVVHLATETGVACTSKPRGEVFDLDDSEKVTCKRCLAKPVATETPAPAPVVTEAKRSGKKTPKDCACGCGEQTGGGLYRPGHDARHAGQLVRAVAAGDLTLSAALDLVGSDALRGKVSRGVERASVKKAS